jgi:hypothetical protein
MPPGYHYRRGHWVKNPSSRKKKAASGWIAAAVVAVGVWALSHGYAQPDSAKHPASPSPTATTAARR